MALCSTRERRSIHYSLVLTRNLYTIINSVLILWSAHLGNCCRLQNVLLGRGNLMGLARTASGLAHPVGPAAGAGGCVFDTLRLYGMRKRPRRRCARTFARLLTDRRGNGIIQFALQASPADIVIRDCGGAVTILCRYAKLDQHLYKQHRKTPGAPGFWVGAEEITPVRGVGPRYCQHG
jgi:hypothetical protein